jgi:predicted DCC family thiol-disulfide oxidoreductase YuxK
MKNKINIVLLYDEECKLCNSILQFIIKRDLKMKFRFAALQSERGQTLLKKFDFQPNYLESLIFIQGNQYYIKSSAVLNILMELGFVWKIFFLMRLIPLPIRDFIYTIIAKSRYKLFGKCDKCKLPTWKYQ